MDAHAFLPPIVRFYRARRRMPSLRELAALYGFRSQNAAAKVVVKLLAAGVLAKDRTGRLLPTPHFAPLRMLQRFPLAWRGSTKIDSSYEAISSRTQTTD